MNHAGQLATEQDERPRHVDPDEEQRQHRQVPEDLAEADGVLDVVPEGPLRQDVPERTGDNGPRQRRPRTHRRVRNQLVQDEQDEPRCRECHAHAAGGLKPLRQQQRPRLQMADGVHGCDRRQRPERQEKPEQDEPTPERSPPRNLPDLIDGRIERPQNGHRQQDECAQADGGGGVHAAARTFDERPDLLHQVHLFAADSEADLRDVQGLEEGLLHRLAHLRPSREEVDDQQEQHQRGDQAQERLERQVACHHQQAVAHEFAPAEPPQTDLVNGQPSPMRQFARGALQKPPQMLGQLPPTFFQVKHGMRATASAHCQSEIRIAKSEIVTRPPHPDA